MRLKALTILALAIALMAGACGKKDADIQKAVQDKLAADNVTGVTATVKDGVATLSGEVADVTVKSKAENSAKTVEGVKSVVNSITTRPLPTATPAMADNPLKGTLEEALKKAGCTGATVDVINGKVTISGTVPEAKYTTCIQVVNQSGAVGIQNDIKKCK